jgi:hypothetical protein
VPEHGVVPELQRLAERPHVRGHPLERPRLFGRPLGTALGALVDQEQAVLVAEPVEVVAEHPMVAARPAVEDEKGIAGAPFDDIEPRVADVDKPSVHPAIVRYRHRVGPPLAVVVTRS